MKPTNCRCEKIRELNKLNRQNKIKKKTFEINLIISVDSLSQIKDIFTQTEKIVYPWLLSNRICSYLWTIFNIFIFCMLNLSFLSVEIGERKKNESN
jgi:hypothetical protein